MEGIELTVFGDYSQYLVDFQKLLLIDRIRDTIVVQGGPK